MCNNKQVWLKTFSANLFLHTLVKNQLKKAAVQDILITNQLKSNEHSRISTSMYTFIFLTN